MIITVTTIKVLERVEGAGRELHQVYHPAARRGRARPEVSYDRRDNLCKECQEFTNEY